MRMVREVGIPSCTVSTRSSQEYRSEAATMAASEAYNLANFFITHSDSIKCNIIFDGDILIDFRFNGDFVLDWNGGAEQSLGLYAQLGYNRSIICPAHYFHLFLIFFFSI